MSVLSFLSCMSAFLRICRWFVFLSFVTVFVYFFLESLHSDLSLGLVKRSLCLSSFVFHLPFFRCSLSGLCVPSFLRVVHCQFPFFVFLPFLFRLSVGFCCCCC